MSTLSVPPLPGGLPVHDLTGCFGKLTKPSVIRGSELCRSAFGPPLDGLYVGRPLLPPVMAVPPVAGFGAGGALEHASISSDSPALPASAPEAVKRKNRRRLTV